MTHTPSTPPNWHLQETYKSLITISVECLKMLALINGGAAVAILTYLGNLVGHSSNQHSINITPAILWYCWGLLATVVAFMFSYWVQLRLYHEERDSQAAQQVRRWHQLVLWGAMGLAIFAAVAFGVGCWKAATVLGT